MGRRNGQPPRMTRHKATNRARLRVGGRDLYGPDWGRHKKPSEACNEWYHGLIARWGAAGGLLPDIDRPTVASAVLAASDPARNFTVAELAVRYIEHCEQHYRRPDGSPTGTAKLVENAFRFAEGWYRVPAIDFKAPQLIEVRNHIIKTAGPQRWVTTVEGGKEVRRQERQPPSRTYVNDTINRIRTAFRWGAERGLVPGTVAYELAAVRSLRAGRGEGARETPPVLPVSDDTFLATLELLPNVVADLLRVIRLTGARPGEICSMRPEDITTTGESGQPLQVWRFHPTIHKNAHRGLLREIYINEAAQSVLQPYLDGRAPEAYVFDTAESRQTHYGTRRAGRKTPHTPSSRTRQKRAKKDFRSAPYDANSLRRAITRACERGGLKKWSPNQIRHAAGTEARQIGDLDAAQALLGHRERSTTERYAAPSQGLGELVALQIGKRPSNSTKQPVMND